jgi:hypothetical protein
VLHLINRLFQLSGCLKRITGMTKRTGALILAADPIIFFSAGVVKGRGFPMKSDELLTLLAAGEIEKWRL